MSSKESLEHTISILGKQEELLIFEQFTREDAWSLGTILSGEIRSGRFPAATAIWLNSGAILFQYLGEGSGLDNEIWMRRKFNVVRRLDRSSLLFFCELERNGKKLEDRGLAPADYAASGGGFPIRLKNAGVIGAVTFSGLPHFKDHAVIVNSIGKFLGIGNVPEVSQI